VLPRVTLSAVTSEGDVLSDASASRIGTTLLGKYTIEHVLGIGGMGVVYAATHRNGKRFAVKLLHPEYSVRRDLRARFLREGYVANAVNHPGVVAILDDDVAEDGSAFLVMELLEGNTVETLGARPGGRMPVRAALGIALQLLDVLDAAHCRDITHRDIKPANLFVLRDGQVKVLDFGLARLRDATTGINTTRTGETLGTPAFMPPEQARGEFNSIDARTDIWAVGATVFTAISGCIVHEGDNARQVMVRAATMPSRSLSSVAPGAPESVVQLIAKALEFDKSARWDSAKSMREAVTQAYAELFGAPLREHLKSLFDMVTDSVSEAPTRPSPFADSIQTIDSSVVMSGSVTVPPGASTRRGGRFELAAQAPNATRRNRVVRVVLGVSGAALLVGAWAAWNGRSGHTGAPRLSPVASAHSAPILAVNPAPASRQNAARERASNDAPANPPDVTSKRRLIDDAVDHQ
jgi:eukaryotic-like serine/threonine-protein kinase